MARKKESVNKSTETDINYVSPEAYNNEMVSLAMDFLNVIWKLHKPFTTLNILK